MEPHFNGKQQGEKWRHAMGDAASSDKSADKSLNKASSEKYQQANKLELRNEIQKEYRSNPVPWFTWMFDSLELSQDSAVLDLGGGTGAFWQENAARVTKSWNILLSDRSLDMVRKAQADLRRTRQIIGFLTLDGQSLPFPKESFDAVCAVGLLDLVPDLDQLLSEAWRVLRPAGQFIATAGGKGHLQELENLLRPFVPAQTVEQIGGDEDRFGLENGEKLLSRYFEEVIRHDYPDRLVFTSLEPILEYILSEQEIVWSMPLNKLGNIVHRIKDDLEKNGEILVTVRKGMFVARKKVMSEK